MSAPKKKNALASAVEAFVGIRVELPTGAIFRAKKPLLFRDALRWQELLERYTAGGPNNGYSETLGVIVDELEAKTDPEDMSVCNDLTLGEFLDYVVYSFFSHRRSMPGWMVQLLAQRNPAAQNAKLPPPATSPSSPNPT